MIGVYHLRSVLSDEIVDQVKSYYNKLDTTVVSKKYQETLYDTWYDYGPSLPEPGVTHLCVDPSKLPDINNDILAASTEIFNHPFEHDGKLNIIQYLEGGESPLHYDGTGKFTGKEYTCVCMIDDDFDGGEFIINDELIPFNKGDMLIFQINFLHRVKPVTSGSRVTLVARLMEA